MKRYVWPGFKQVQLMVGVGGRSVGAVRRYRGRRLLSARHMGMWGPKVRTRSHIRGLRVLVLRLPLERT